MTFVFKALGFGRVLEDVAGVFLEGVASLETLFMNGSASRGTGRFDGDFCLDKLSFSSLDKLISCLYVENTGAN